MFVDTSALVAILAREPEAAALRRRRRFPRDDASITEESGRNVRDTHVEAVPPNR